MLGIDILPSALIQTGDLLAWKEDSVSTFSNSCIKTVRALTKKKYGHVGIAWRCHDGLDDELFVIEATIPKVHIARIVASRDFDCVPMGVNWTPECKKFLTSKLGLEYGFFDAVRALLGLRLSHDDRYQCAELCHEFYETCGINLSHDFTPGGIVTSAIHHRQQRLFRVVP